jgi:hypothetical protein
MDISTQSSHCSKVAFASITHWNVSQTTQLVIGEHGKIPIIMPYSTQCLLIPLQSKIS